MLLFQASYFYNTILYIFSVKLSCDEVEKLTANQQTKKLKVKEKKISVWLLFNCNSAIFQL